MRTLLSGEAVIALAGTRPCAYKSALQLIQDTILDGLTPRWPFQPDVLQVQKFSALIAVCLSRLGPNHGAQAHRCSATIEAICPVASLDAADMNEEITNLDTIFVGDTKRRVWLFRNGPLSLIQVTTTDSGGPWRRTQKARHGAVKPHIGAPGCRSAISADPGASTCCRSVSAASSRFQRGRFPIDQTDWPRADNGMRRPKTQGFSTNRQQLRMRELAFVHRASA